MMHGCQIWSGGWESCQLTKTTLLKIVPIASSKSRAGSNGFHLVLNRLTCAMPRQVLAPAAT
jgi:hypothetical protein